MRTHSSTPSPKSWGSQHPLRRYRILSPRERIEQGIGIDLDAAVGRERLPGVLTPATPGIDSLKFALCPLLERVD